MKKMSAILGLVLMSSTVFASTKVHCIRGGGVNVNLPSNAYFLNMQTNSNTGMEIRISERAIDATKGNLVLKAYLEFESRNQQTLRNTYVSPDRRITMTINERQDGKILSAYISGTGEGLDRRRTFAFEGRSCSQGE
jgi:hypothetical protein